nr:protein disulfide-isomerase-like [Rhipicephalus microplus]
MEYLYCTNKCEALASKFAKAAKQLEEEGSYIKLAKVYARFDGLLAWKYLRGLPTLTFFRNGHPVYYKGNHTIEEMIQWVKKKTEPPAQLISTVDDARIFVDSAEVTIVGFFKNQTSLEAKEFLKAAYTIDRHCFDERRKTLALKPTCDKIRTFVAVNSQPLVVELTEQNINDLLSGPIRQYSLLFYSKNSANMTEALKNFREAAASFRHKVVFVTINVDKEEIELILMYFRIWQDNVPALRFAEYDGVGSVTPFMPETDSLKTEDINTFVEGVLNGSIKDTPWLPDSFNSTIHRAKVVVQENFDEVVFDKTKDVLVLFYSPWCTPCYHLTLHYDWLANMYNDHEDLLIVKMDATMNELEHTDIHSFPTLRLYKKQNNEFEGDEEEKEGKELGDEVPDDMDKNVDKEQGEKEGDKKRDEL